MGLLSWWKLIHVLRYQLRNAALVSEVLSVTSVRSIARDYKGLTVQMYYSLQSLKLCLVTVICECSISVPARPP